jgi:ion channel POLLUX/CASTOR
MSRYRRILLLGWNHKVPALLREFDGNGEERFRIDVLAAVPVEERAARLLRHDINLHRVTVHHIEGDYTVPSDLAKVRPGDYDNVVLLGSDWLETGEEADARTILGYLLLREMLPDFGGPEILLELMDPGSIALFRSRRSEVLVSPVVLGHILAQVALRRELRAVFDELFGPGGAEIFFQPTSLYAAAGGGVTFRQLRASAARRGETALGVRIAERDDNAGGVFLNPPPEQQWQLSPDDELVVLASYHAGPGAAEQHLSTG